MDQPTDITGVVFDFDGTLFRMSMDWERAANIVGKSKAHTLGERIEALLHERDSDTLGQLTKLEVEAVKSGEPMPGALSMLAGSTFAHIAIFTRNSRHAVLHALPKLGLPASTIVIGREDVTRLKPNPEGLLIAMGEMGLKPEQVIVVGDTYHDVEAAHAVGLRAIIVKNPELQFTPEGADGYVASLSELQTLIAQGAR